MTGNIACVRLFGSVLALICFSIALADRTIDTPTGYTLRPGEFRLDYRESGSGLKDRESFGTVGVLPFLELGFDYQAFDKQRSRGTVNAQYSLIQPYPDLLPGISVGVLDILNRTDRGRVIFVAATYQFNLVETWVNHERINLTVGAGTGLRGAFANLYWPLYTHVAFLAEHDSRHFKVGIDLEPVAGLAFRATVQDGLPQFGIQVRRIF